MDEWRNGSQLAGALFVRRWLRLLGGTLARLTYRGFAPDSGKACPYPNTTVPNNSKEPLIGYCNAHGYPRPLRRHDYMSWVSHG